MKIDRLGHGPPDMSERDEARGLGGERDLRQRFSLDVAGGAEGIRAEEERLYSERAGEGRRRMIARAGRRSGEGQGPREVQAEETRRSERSEGRFDCDLTSGEAPHREEQEAVDRSAAAADFEVLATHLLRLGGAIREVTLYLPSIGQVTARMEAGAISISATVPKRLVDAVRRGEGDLRERLARIGLKVAHVRIEAQEGHEPREDQPPRPPPYRLWPTRGLVDVMA